MGCGGWVGWAVGLLGLAVAVGLLGLAVAVGPLGLAVAVGPLGLAVAVGLFGFGVALGPAGLVVAVGFLLLASQLEVLWQLEHWPESCSLGRSLAWQLWQSMVELWTNVLMVQAEVLWHCEH